LVVAIGALVRDQVLAVTGALAWIAVVEHIVVDLVPDVGRWLPGAGQAIVRTSLDGLLSPVVGGAAVLAVYAGAICLLGGRVTLERDV
jgi:ABC-2 type transport system permease protein